MHGFTSSPSSKFSGRRAASLLAMWQCGIKASGHKAATAGRVGTEIIFVKQTIPRLAAGLDPAYGQQLTLNPAPAPEQKQDGTARISEIPDRYQL